MMALPLTMAQMDPATAYLVVNLSLEDESTLKFRVRTCLSTPSARFSLRVPGANNILRNTKSAKFW